MKLFGFDITRNKTGKGNQQTVNKSVGTMPFYVNTPVSDILSNKKAQFGTRSIYQNIDWYENIPQVFIPINRISNSFIKGKISVYSLKNGKQLGSELQNDELLTVLQNPNNFQGGTEFWKMLYDFYATTGTALIYRTKIIGFGEQWFILPTHLVDFEFNDNSVIHTSFQLSDVVKKAELTTYSGKKVGLDLEKIIVVNKVGLNGMRSYYLGNSPLNHAYMPIENIRISYEADNVLLTNRGVEGIFSGMAMKGDFGFESIPMDAADKEAIETSFKYKYGLMQHQNRFAFTSKPVNYTKIGDDVAKLRIIEGRSDNYRAVLACLGVDPVLVGEDAKYLNKEEAEKQLFENVIISDATSIFNTINSQLKLADENKKIVIDYSHISCLQPDKKLDAETSSINIATVLNVNEKLSNGTIDYDTAVIMLQLECGYTKEESIKLVTKPVIIEETANTDDGSSKFSNEQLMAQAKLRGTVGGIDGTIGILQSVADGITEYESAMGILMIFFGFDRETAQLILGKKPNGNNTNNATGTGNSENENDSEENSGA